MKHNLNQIADQDAINNNPDLNSAKNGDSLK